MAILDKMEAALRCGLIAIGDHGLKKSIDSGECKDFAKSVAYLHGKNTEDQLKTAFEKIQRTLREYEAVKGRVVECPVVGKRTTGGARYIVVMVPQDFAIKEENVVLIQAAQETTNE